MGVTQAQTNSLFTKQGLSTNNQKTNDFCKRVNVMRTRELKTCLTYREVETKLIGEKPHA